MDGPSCSPGRNGTGCACLAGFFGGVCSACSCPSNSSEHAALCADGMSGDGHCYCGTGFTGVATGCGTCTPGRFGTACAPCDCPVNTVCSEGILGTGECRCAGASCETDSTAAFLVIVATEFYSNRQCALPQLPTPRPTTPPHGCSAPRPTALPQLTLSPAQRPSLPRALPRYDPFPHTFEPTSPSFAVSQAAYQLTNELADDVTQMQVVFAPSQWGARALVTSAYGGVISVLCNASVDAAVPGAAPAELHNATAAMDVLSGLQGYPSILGGGQGQSSSALPPLPSSHHRLLRSCPFIPLIGQTEVGVEITSPDGSSHQSYTIQLSRDPSTECRLANLFLFEPGGPLPGLWPGWQGMVASRPDFSLYELRYNAAIANTSDGFGLNATTLHTIRCGGHYDGQRCMRPAMIRIVVLDADDPSVVLSDGGWEANHSISNYFVTPPLGRSVLQLQVAPESHVLSMAGIRTAGAAAAVAAASPAPPSCTYAIHVARGLSADVALASLSTQVRLPSGLPYRLSAECHPIII